jgi:hypothetical protein
MFSLKWKNILNEKLNTPTNRPLLLLNTMKRITSEGTIIMFLRQINSLVLIFLNAQSNFH